MGVGVGLPSLFLNTKLHFILILYTKDPRRSKDVHFMSIALKESDILFQSQAVRNYRVKKIIAKEVNLC